MLAGCVHKWQLTLGRLAFVADFGTQNFHLKTKFDMENKTSTNNENGNDANRLLADVVDSLEFIADSLSEEALLRQMIDDWCIKQLGNTEESLEVADKMFTAARDIFYNVS